MDYKLLILENDVSLEKNFISELRKHTPEEPFILNALLLREKETLSKYINKAEKIAFKSSFVHTEQLNMIMVLFNKLSKKMVFIKTDNREILESHPLYKENSNKHEIIYI